MGDFLKYQKLPPGWDCKFDQATGNCYYVNYLTKAMQLEDPRNRYRQLQNDRCSTESIPLQHLHGGPPSSGGSPYHVYPSNNLTVMRAFHAPCPSGSGMPPSSIYGTSTSPLLTSRGQLEMSPLPLQKSSMGIALPMQTPRMMANMSRRSTIQETSFSTHIDTDAVVAKIQNMFPTASENHIRLLLKKYYNREAVVISALQVEKHPVTMPGPIATPPAQRHLLFHSNSAAFHMTPPARRLDLGCAQSLASRGATGTQSRTASPTPAAYFGRFGSVMSVQGGYSALGHGSPGLGRVLTDAALMQCYAPGSPQWRSSPKPHSSPKMKLRYMKNIFPKADELLILDILAESDNNVQMASEKLLALGYVKRDYMQPPKVSSRVDGAGGTDAADGGAANSGYAKEGQIIIPLRPKEYSSEEKAAMHQRLKEQYPRIAERIIVMALESVSYGEDRAMQILQIVQEEEEAKAAAAGLLMAGSVGHKDISLTEGRPGGDEQAGDNLIAVVVDAGPAPRPEDAPPPATTSTTTTDTAPPPPPMPSINVTTPTTATTQTILSQAGWPPSDDKANVRAPPPPHATSSPPSSQASSSPSSPPSPPLSPTCTFAYEKLTTAGLLGRCAANMHDTFSPTTTCAADYMNHHSATITASAASASPPSSIASLLDTLKLTRRSRDKSETLKNSQRNSTESSTDEQKLRSQFKTLIGRIKTEGHNPDLSCGPDEDLLLADYVTWNGANPHIALGPRNQYLAQGPDASVLAKRPFTALGHNADLCKGPQKSLAKGSVYSQLSSSATGAPGASNVLKCN